MNSTQFNEELAHALHSIWTPETYRSFYDEAYCLTNNVTLKSRSNAEGQACCGACVSRMRFRVQGHAWTEGASPSRE